MFCLCLPIFIWFSSSSTTGLQKHKIFSFFQKAYSDLYPRWATQKAYEQWNIVCVWSYTELQELKFPEVQGLSSVGFEPKIFSEQNFLSKNFSWLKKEWMNVKSLSCRDVQIFMGVVTWSVHGQPSHRLLIKGCSGLSYIFLWSNSYLH